MSSSKGILVVEDDDAIRNGLQGLLELEGYQVSAASNGREGLDLLQKINRPCVILLDFMMPVMNGREFSDQLRQDDLLATIPIVVVSAYGDKAKSIPSSGFIKKPIEFDGLLSFVRQFCGQMA